MYIKGSFDLSDSLFSLRLSGFIFRSGNFLPDPVFLYLPEQTNKSIIVFLYTKLVADCLWASSLGSQPLDAGQKKVTT